MRDSATLQDLDEAIQKHHNATREDDEPPMVVGWIAAYIATDGDGRESICYSVGEGTTTATAIGLASWAKDTITTSGEEA